MKTTWTAQISAVSNVSSSGSATYTVPRSVKLLCVVLSISSGITAAGGQNSSSVTLAVGAAFFTQSSKVGIQNVLGIIDLNYYWGGAGTSAGQLSDNIVIPIPGLELEARAPLILEVVAGTQGPTYGEALLTFIDL